ncbi:MAG: glycosyltransferase [Chitinophagales bacterium]
MQQINSSGGMIAIGGVKDKFFGIIRTALFIKPDIIHFDWIESFYYRRWGWLTYVSIPSFFLQLFVAKYICKIRIAFTLHNIFPHDTKNKRLHNWVHTKFMRQTDAVRVFYTSSIQKVSDLFDVPPVKIKVAVHPHYIQYYPNTISKTEARKILSLPEGKKIFLFFGTIRKYKGLDELIYIFNTEQFHESVLLIAGKVHDVEYANNLIQELPKNVFIHTEFIKNGDVQKYFNACDAVILPFKNVESSGSVILAMGFAKPVITSSTFAVAEVLKQQEQLLYIDELRSAITAALKHSTDQLKEIGRLNFDVINQNQSAAFSDIFLGLKNR